MKKAILKTILGGVLVLSLHTVASAQVSVSINIGSQPAWGPSGYNHVDYYYLPDIESYYDVATGQYIYLDGGRWIFANNLPPRYRGYDLYSGYKVVVNRSKPYLNYSRDRVNYGRYKNWSGTRQPMLRESRNNGNRNMANNRNRSNNGGVNRPGNMNHSGNVNGNGNMNRSGNMNQGRPQGQVQNRPAQNNGQVRENQRPNGQSGQNNRPNNNNGHEQRH